MSDGNFFFRAGQCRASVHEARKHTTRMMEAAEGDHQDITQRILDALNEANTLLAKIYNDTHKQATEGEGDE